MAVLFNHALSLRLEPLNRLFQADLAGIHGGAQIVSQGVEIGDRCIALVAREETLPFRVDGAIVAVVLSGGRDSCD